jgi:hypothetical protein
MIINKRKLQMVARMMQRLNMQQSQRWNQRPKSAKGAGSMYPLSCVASLGFLLAFANTLHLMISGQLDKA